MRSLTVCVMLAASGSAHGSAVHLLEEAGPAAPDHTQAEQLDETLLRFDPRVLELLGGQGVRIGIARTGVALADLQLFKARAGAEDLGALRGLAGAYQRAARPFDRELQKLHGQVADLGPVQLPEYVFGQGPPKFTPLQHRLAELQSQISDLESSKREAQARVISLDSAAIPFTLLNQPANLVEQVALLQKQEAPQSVLQMSQACGARTADQVRRYNHLVELINGERLRAARDQALAGASETTRMLWGSDPTQIPVDHRSFNLLLPNLFFEPDGRGGFLELTARQAVSARVWSGLDGKISGKGSVVGEYFPESGRILIREDSVRPEVLAHELGHAIEAAVQQRQPEFHRGWVQRRKASYDRAVHGQTVSDYARRSPSEYSAEGVAHVFDPQMASEDSGLYDLTRELLERATR